MQLLFIGVGINLLVIALVYIHLNGKIKKRESSDHIIPEIRREVDELLVELNQTTDRNVGIIEDRIKRVSRTVEEADKRIRLLQKSTDTFTMSSATYSNIRPVIHGNNGTRPDTREVPEKQAEPEPDGEEREYNPEEKRKKVRELYMQGLSAEVIASKLDSTVGEIEFMITLMEERNR